MNYSPIPSNSIPAILTEYFNELNNAEITVVVIGANNGELKDFLGSYLHYKNVKGLLVEPVKKLFNELCSKFAEYKNLFFENAAIDKRTGKKNIYTINAKSEFPIWTAGLGSFNRNVILSHENQLKDMKSHVEKELVSCITFDALLKKYNLKHVNLLQVDTEGHDYEIVKSIDFKKYRPDILIVEYLHITGYQYFALVNLLQANNYTVSKNYESFDLLAVSNSIFE